MSVNSRSDSFSRCAHLDAVALREVAVNRLGYRLLRQKKIEPALQIFLLNLRLYPESCNVYDSLGEAYMIKGDKELAIKNYAKSLVLNPKNTNAIEMLKKISDK